MGTSFSFETLDTPKSRGGFACRRWSARVVDFAVSAIFYSLLTGALVHYGLIRNTLGFFGIFVFPFAFYFFVDTILLSIFKTTIGRSLSCIGLESSSGGALTFSALAKRNLIVWLSGFWCGVLVPIPFLIHYFAVKRDGKTKYDDRCTIKCYPLPYASWRAVVSLVVVVLCMQIIQQANAIFPDVEFMDRDDAFLHNALENTAQECLMKSKAYTSGLEKSGIWKMLGDNTGDVFKNQIAARDYRKTMEEAYVVAKTMFDDASTQMRLYGDRRTKSKIVKGMLAKHNETWEWFRKRSETMMKICEELEYLQTIVLWRNGCKEVVREKDRQVINQFKRENTSEQLQDQAIVKRAVNFQKLIQEYTQLGQQFQKK